MADNSVVEVLRPPLSGAIHERSIRVYRSGIARIAWPLLKQLAGDKALGESERRIWKFTVELDKSQNLILLRALKKGERIEREKQFVLRTWYANPRARSPLIRLGVPLGHLQLEAKQIQGSYRGWVNKGILFINLNQAARVRK